MAHWTRIAGVVTRGDAPVDRAYVTVRDTAGNFTGERRTEVGGEGRFAFHLGPGRWVLEAVAAGSELVRREVELAPGEEAEVRIELP
jgi:uncharacterized protein DUF1416